MYHEGSCNPRRSLHQKRFLAGISTAVERQPRWNQSAGRTSYPFGDLHWSICWTSAPIGNGSLCMGLLRRKEAPSFSLQSLNCWKTRWNFPKPSAFERQRLQTFTHSTGFPALWSSLIYTAGLKWLLDWHLTHSWDSTGSPRRTAQRCIFRQNTLVSFWRSKRWVWEWNLKRRNNLQTQLLPKQKEMAEVVDRTTS